MIKQLTDSAIASLPEKPKLSKKFWSNDKFLKDLLDKKQQVVTNQERNSLGRKIKKHLIHLQNMIFKKQAEEISLLNETRQAEREFKMIKEAATKTVFKRLDPKPGCLPQDLLNFAKSHLSKSSSSLTLPTELTEPPNYILDLKKLGDYEKIDQDAPTAQEIKDTLSKLRNNRASDDIPPEFLKYAIENDDFVKNLQVMFQKIWKGEEIPSNWGLGKIVTIYKNKGKRNEAKNYRLLTISSAVGKIFRTLIVNRLNPWYNAQLSLSQNGFRKSYGTNDAILRNKMIQV